MLSFSSNHCLTKLPLTYLHAREVSILLKILSTRLLTRENNMEENRPQD
jgi:hypothetical protein